MGKVLTTASTVTCGHPTPVPPEPPPSPMPGQVTASSERKLKVQGSPVLVKSSLLQADVKDCPNTVSPAKPCKKVTGVVSGESLKLKAGGSPVMLDEISLTTDGSVPPPPVLKPGAGQSKLSSV
ncbi:hypothetical protein MTF65_03885 [Streptomyces sp. APSN-46.1]|uniref:hypothetical protein n=1 Tax=Streptomyces sp. APSN-46.1 TaxID=2929049 RepID=UPI001FB4CFB6|nr:hypothetical protein [Streptomyces sp. APSN-46.1]MCJ1676504.1 hypothetical protein [Streptomyces sp. APSN-46.1]